MVDTEPHMMVEGNDKKDVVIDEYHLSMTPEFYEEFCGLETDSEKWMCMSRASDLEYYADNMKSQIIQEYLFHNLHFCANNSLNYNQANSVVFVLQHFLKTCAFDKSVNVDSSVEIFRQQVSSTLLSGDEENRINIETLQKFLDFFIKSIVQHLVLYQSVFDHVQEEVVEPMLLAVQTPMEFPSLASCIQGNSDEGEQGEPYDDEFEPLSGR